MFCECVCVRVTDGECVCERVIVHERVTERERESGGCVCVCARARACVHMCASAFDQLKQLAADSFRIRIMLHHQN